MAITFKHLNGRHIVTVNDKRFRFPDAHKAWTFVGDINEYGVEYTKEVYEKINCLYQLHQLKHDKHKSPDCREDNVRKMLLSLRSSILMDNAVRGILVGDYTLNNLLARKGF